MTTSSYNSVYVFLTFGYALTFCGAQDSVYFSVPDRFKGCRLDQFRCTNGDCISSEYLCDGKKECADGSDETRSQCLRPEITCPAYAFRCNYGACVDGDATCNGVNDCADGSDESLQKCSQPQQPKVTARPTCSINQFQCESGQCIDSVSLCDGSPDCADRSDETATACAGTQCEPYTFRCRYGACIDGDLKCNGVRNCADGSDEDSINCGGGRPTPRPPAGTTSTPRRTYPTAARPSPTSAPTPWTPRPQQNSCPTPPYIENGFWKLHSSQCSSNNHCDPRQGTNMVPGTHIIYFCNSGYHLKQSADVFCASTGTWSHIPKCHEVRCKALSTSSTKADCTLDGQWTSCEVPVLPRTQADISCRTSYSPEGSVWRRNRVTCNSRGHWEPEPIKCTPVCGVKPLKNVKPLIVGGTMPNITDFPWHATIYTVNQETDDKTFICGATIIKEDLLITAAHCVFDEVTKRVENPRKYVIATGNFYKDYDFEYPPPIVVKKARVKNIYINCDYQGLDGNYDRDIAILEIDTPFTFTSHLVPICLDTTSQRRAIEFGTRGVVAGFGKTAEGTFSSVLQSLEVPVVPNNLCALNSAAVDAQKYITLDKFCAGYTNGSSVCDGDSGGGLVFETQGLWYLRGIVSIGIGTNTLGGTRSCDSHRYALYTEVFSHMTWIQDMMLKLETAATISPCSRRT